MESCKLCKRELKKAESVGGVPPVLRLECPTCGVYEIDVVTASIEPGPFVEDKLYLISAVARWMSDRDNDNVLRVDQALLKDRSEFESRILSVCPRNTQEIMDRILAYIAEETIYPGKQTRIDVDSISPLFYCRNVKEVISYLNHLQDSNLVVFTGPTPEGNGTKYIRLELTVKGKQKAEEQAKPNIESTQAFVAMWFDDEMTSAFSEGILPLQEDTGFTMLRIDVKQFNDKICDKIIAEIKRSRFVIADLTGQRHAVYFEAGFAKGFGLPVIWTCRKDQKDEIKNDFDTRQYSYIFWTEPSKLREELRDRILATIGTAPK
jgi:hypothetical protein